MTNFYDMAKLGANILDPMLSVVLKLVMILRHDVSFM